MGETIAICFARLFSYSKNSFNLLQNAGLSTANTRLYAANSRAICCSESLFLWIC